MHCISISTIPSLSHRAWTPWRYGRRGGGRPSYCFPQCLSPNLQSCCHLSHYHQTNTILAGLVEGLEGRIDSGKVAERCSFTCGSYLCTVAVVTIANPFRAMAIAPPAVAEDSKFRLVGGSRPNNRLRLAKHCLMR
jgi:hypothetical protein